MASARRQAVAKAWLAAGLIAAPCASTFATTVSTVESRVCRADTNQFRRDPTTGWSWKTLWYCHNRAGAALYEDASFRTKIARMQTEPSWFVCYRHGAKQAGGNDIWYYTLGDVSEPAFQRRQPWGFMPAADVFAATHPWPGIPRCPVPPFPVTVKRKPP